MNDGRLLIASDPRSLGDESARSAGAVGRHEPPQRTIHVSEPHDPWQQTRLPREQRVERRHFPLPRDEGGNHLQQYDHEEPVEGNEKCKLVTGPSSWDPGCIAMKFGWPRSDGGLARGGEFPLDALPQMIRRAVKHGYLTDPMLVVADRIALALEENTRALDRVAARVSSAIEDAASPDVKPGP